MMRILLTGQVGLNKSKYLENAKNIANKCGYNLNFKSIGRCMIKNYPGKIEDTSILNLSKTELDLLRKFTWEQIIDKFKKSKEKDSEIFIVNTHAVFRWRHGLFSALELELIQEFAPDMIIVLIDDIIQVKKGLQERETDFFEFWELFAWREEEIWFSKFIADSISKILSKKVDFYIVPKSQGSDLFVKLLIERDKPKIYISFPITGIKENEKIDIEEFKTKIAESFITFDPYAIKDRELTFTHYTIEDEVKENLGKVLNALDSIEILPETIWKPYKNDLSPLTLTKLHFDTTLLGRELLSVLKAIDGQIISRDYLLIDQVDFVIMYIRMDDEGSPKISAGCQSEMVYAYNSGKKVYVIFNGGERKLSPWITQFSKVFVKMDEAFKFILKMYN